MEPENSLIRQGDNEKDGRHVETAIGVENTTEKLNENSVEIDVMSLEAGQPILVVQEPLVPDLTLFSPEVQHGYRILRELLSDSYKSITYPFIQPVDVDGLNLWDYHARIETPMSFNQIESKFKSYSYESITAVVSDMRLILENCYRYNGSSHWVSKLAHKLEKVLDQKLALLNRSLREKVTLRATMALRNKREITHDDAQEPDLGSRPRRSGRTSYGGSGEDHSSLMTHLLIEEEENQREMKRLKEKEKKEANEALMQELSEWEEEIFTKNVLKELRSMWEIPSIGSFLWLFQSALNLPELNFTEFERGFVLPHKSQQMAWIFTSLLVTPSQRKSIHKKSPMKFNVWQRKLKERVDVWYLARQDEELQMVARQIGLNPTFFEILGESNPLETNSYIDLTLHQRVLIMKVLCEECLDYHPQLRDVLGNTDTTPYSETYLGYDGNNSSYLYFPIFDATDVRIYKQAELPALNEWYRKWTSSSKAFRSSKTPNRASQSKSRRSSTSKASKKSKSLGRTIEPGFELVCSDVESLRGLCERFAEHPPTPSRRKSGGRPTRKRCEKELHQVLCGLHEELTRNDARYSRAKAKGLINLMKDWKTIQLDSGDEFSAKGDETGDTAEGDLHTPLQDRTQDPTDNTNAEEIPGEEGAPLLSMVTRSRKRKLLDYDSISASSSPVSEISKNFETCDDNPDLATEISAKKRPNLDDDVIQDSVTPSKEFCDVIVRDVVYDVVRSVVDDVICDIVDDAISNVSVSGSADEAMNGVDNDGQVGTTMTRNGNEGHDDTNGLDHIRISADDNEQQLIETGCKNGESGGNSGTAMDVDGVEDKQSGTCVDKISNDVTNESEHKEQNGNANDIEHALLQNTEVNIVICTNGRDEKSDKNTTDCVVSDKVQNHLGTNGSDAGHKGTAVYNDGQCCETTVCNGNQSVENHGAKTPSEKEPTIPIGKESPGLILRDTTLGE